ncbi:NUDIX hydrolase [Curvivirga aplysinae]|uniref:NUDIX hydrolase n=1 Tax=Curvivirga aplysinae TaxID=2529852 RepID=UPI0012BBC896|nr:DUF4743 domain-containing protein [Curvivirga aplysinae]MTI11303.1 DUF4743 domain-containing protein [Curvivirga aplysinae]
MPGFYRHIEFANNADITHFLPYVWQGKRIGWIRKTNLDFLSAHSEAFNIQSDQVILAPKIDTYEGRSNVLRDALSDLYDKGQLGGWWDELYPLVQAYGHEPIAELERGGCPYLGMRSWGVHMTGYVSKPDGLYLWVAKRSMSKRNDPGMLDNMVAGGQPLGLSIKDNMQKECEEEAGIPLSLSQHLKPVGSITYCYEHKHGLKPDQIFNFDLELPEDFIPQAMDGEVDSFTLMPVHEVMELISQTDDMKYNCNLVFIDFFIRHGYLHADNEPEYSDICLGLQQ